MPGRNLKYPIVERARQVAPKLDGVIKGFGIPARGNTGGEKSLDFRSQVKSSVVKRVEEWLNAKAIASGKDSLVLGIPDDEGEFSPQAVEALCAEVFVKMKRDL